MILRPSRKAPDFAVEDHSQGWRVVRITMLRWWRLSPAAVQRGALAKDL